MLHVIITIIWLTLSRLWTLPSMGSTRRFSYTNAALHYQHLPSCNNQLEIHVVKTSHSSCFHTTSRFLSKYGWDLLIAKVHIILSSEVWLRFSPQLRRETNLQFGINLLYIPKKHHNRTLIEKDFLLCTELWDVNNICCD